LFLALDGHKTSLPTDAAGVNWYFICVVHSSKGDNCVRTKLIGNCFSCGLIFDAAGFGTAAN
jgi:hypothetical protein